MKLECKVRRNSDNEWRCKSRRCCCHARCVDCRYRLYSHIYSIVDRFWVGLIFTATGPRAGPGHCAEPEIRGAAWENSAAWPIPGTPRLSGAPPGPRGATPRARQPMRGQTRAPLGRERDPATVRSPKSTHNLICKNEYWDSDDARHNIETVLEFSALYNS